MNIINRGIYFASAALFILVQSCTTAKVTKTESENQLKNIALNGKVYSAVWQQNAGEFRALCYQAYNIATNIVEEKTKTTPDRPFAIITDVDETFLDNSPYAVAQAKLGKEFDKKTWAEWTAKSSAKAYPGSLDFFNYAVSRNVTVFYITNRDGNDKAGTMKNLIDLGFPLVDDQHLIVMKDTSDKEARRQEVLKNYDVILYLGDNLTDFSKIFYKKSMLERNNSVDQLSTEFGKKFIMLPNSGYGDWESALPEFNHKSTPKEKDNIYLKNVTGY